MTESREEPAPPAQAIFEAATDAEATARAVAAAAPTAPERADIAVVHSLAAELREPMRKLLESLADNKYMLGRRYAEWCTGAPMLESAVAAAAMAGQEHQVGDAVDVAQRLGELEVGMVGQAPRERGDDLLTRVA